MHRARLAKSLGKVPQSRDVSPTPDSCLLQDCDALWEDFHNKLVDSTLLNLDAYLLHFPDLKVRRDSLDGCWCVD